MDAKPAWDPEAAKPLRKALGWHILLGADFALLAMALVYVVYAYFQPRPGVVEFGAMELAVSSLASLLLLGVIPFVWAVGTRVGGLHGAIHYLKLERPLFAIPRGILWGLATWLAVVLGLALLVAAGMDDKNPQGEAIASAVTLPLALLVALCAAFGEEIMFRGILQRWIGVWPQAILFGLLHADYGTPAQIVFPLALGLLYGYLVKRGARLWVPIAAHFTFDFVQLALASLLLA